VGRVNELLKPIVKSWHPNREKGEFTHYGDQTLVLLESLAGEGGFVPDAFGRAWEKLFGSYDGYVDKATQAVQANRAAGQGWDQAGSPSTDLGGAARIAPLVLRYADNPGELAAAARTQTAMTHNQAEVVASALFFASVTLAVLDGAAPAAALKEVITRAEFAGSPLAEWVTEGLESAGRDSREIIAAFGQQCEVEAAFPASIHLIASYPDDYQAALIANVMAGGDSASRGLMVGMVLCAHLGMDAIPQAWTDDLKARERIAAALQQLSPSIPG